jgi:5-(carboxyamino)imidazole ribonucleotide synthase
MVAPAAKHPRPRRPVPPSIMTFPLAPGATIGLVGGGQLGRMSALAAARLGYRSHILTREEGSPAGQVAAGVTISDYRDAAGLREFAAAVDVISFEFENVSAEGLDLLASLKPVRPSPATLRISQDRVVEKSFINRVGVATAPWRPVASHEELRAAVSELGLPGVLKTTRLGYDGKGQRTLREWADLTAAFEALAPKPLILERFIDFDCEISVVIARGADDAVSVFDTVENRHKEHILDLTLAPARVAPEVIERSQAIARTLAAELDLIGILAVEMFVDAGGRVLVNEIAPRPHNSGHWTIDACPASQFELHIRAIAGLPLPPPARHSDAVMRNLVGPEGMALWPEIVAEPGLIPHLYGKAVARPGRKMGHVTRLFPKGALPGDFGIMAALGPAAPREQGKSMLPLAGGGHA